VVQVTASVRYDPAGAAGQPHRLVAASSNCGAGHTIGAHDAMLPPTDEVPAGQTWQVEFALTNCPGAHDGEAT